MKKLAALLLPFALASCYNMVTEQPRTLYEKAVHIKDQIKLTELMLAGGSNGEAYQMLQNECEQAGLIYNQSFDEDNCGVRVLLEPVIHDCNRTLQRAFFKQ